MSSQGLVPQKESVRRAYGGMCKRLWESDKESLLEWTRIGNDLFRYGYDRTYLFEYQNMNQNAWFKAKLAKTAEAMQQLGPRLAPLTEITRLLRPRTADPSLMARTASRMAFLNYTPPQTRFTNQRRQAVNDGLCWGGGVLWTGLDKRTGMPSSIWDPRSRTIIDADAKMYEDVRRVNRERIRPRATVMREYPEAADILMKAPRYSGTESSEKDEARGSTPADQDRIRYFETYYNHGISQYQGGSEAYAAALGVGQQSDKDKQALIMQDKDEPLKCCTLDDGQMFWTGPWEVPFYKLPRDGWPVTFYDLYTGILPTRPHSPLEAGLGIQRAMNHLLTLMMSRARMSFRAAFATRKQNGKGPSVQAKDRVFNGSDIVNIEVDFGAASDVALKISDYFEQLDWGTEWLPSAINYMQYLESLYERLTPLSQFLSTGSADSQDRSAEATKVRDRNTMARVDDLKDMVTEADNVISRKETFLASYALKADDVAKMLPDAAINWGALSTPEAKDPQYWLPRLIVGPSFDQIEQTNPQQAQQITSVVPQIMASMDPMQAQQIQQQAQQSAAGAYTLEELIYQTDFEIDTSSTRRHDVDQQIDTLNVDANSIWPLQLQSGDPRQMALAYDALAERSKLSGMDPQLIAGYKKMADDLRQQALAPPPPPPGAPMGQPVTSNQPAAVR